MANGRCLLGIPFPGGDYLDDALISRIGGQVDATELVNAISNALPSDESERFDVIFEIPEGNSEPLYLEGIFEGEARDRLRMERLERASGVRPTYRVGRQHDGEQRVRDVIRNRALVADRQRRIDEELKWLGDNKLFRGRPPAPGEEYGSYVDRIGRQSDRERQNFERRRKRIDRSGNYAVDMDLSGFTADQFDFEG